MSARFNKRVLLLLCFSVIAFGCLQSSALAAGNISFAATSGQMNGAPEPYQTAAHTLLSGKVLLTYRSGLTFKAELFDPATQHFTLTTGQPNCSHEDGTSVQLSNGNVLYAGGFTDSGGSFSSCAEVYNPGSDSFNVVGDTAVPINNAAASVLQDGRVLLAGGDSTDKQGQIFDPSTGQFSLTGSAVYPVWNYRLNDQADTLPDGSVVIVSPATTGTDFLGVAQKYDPTTGTFSAYANTITARFEALVSVLPNHTFLIAGGQLTNGNNSLNTYIFRPVQGTFTRVGDLTQQRLGAGIQTLANGDVMAVNGCYANAQNVCNPTYSAELWDARTQTWRQIDSTLWSRSAPATALLHDGNVLIAGGALTAPQSGAELAIPEKYPLSVTLSGTGQGAVTSSPDGIFCPSDCDQEYDFDSTITLTAHPAPGSVFAGWSGGGCSGTDVCVTSTDLPLGQMVTAEFEPVPPPSKDLTVFIAGTGSGTVSGGPISCPGSCSASVAQGSNVQLTATPGGGSTFVGWSGSGCSGTSTICTVSMSDNQTAVAEFEPVTPPPPGQHTLAVTISGPSGAGTVGTDVGGINCPSACTSSLNDGTTVTLSAFPSPGYTFVGWSGGGCSGTGSCKVTISSDTQVVANFTSGLVQRGNPLAVILSGPPPETADTNATFRFDGENVDSYQCLIDQGQWGDCTTGQTFSVTGGSYHEFQLRGLQQGTGKVSQVATYYWQVYAPQACVLKSGRARAFEYAKQNRVRLVYPYTSYKRAANVNVKLFAVLKGHKQIQVASARLDLKKQAVIRIIKSLPKKVMSQVRKARYFSAQLSIPHTAAACSSYLNRKLSVKQKVAGQFVYFPEDVKNFPGGTTAWLKK